MSTLAAPDTAVSGGPVSVTTITAVTAADTAGYRAVARSLLFNSGDLQASPLHGFTVSHPAFNDLIDRLVPGRKSIVHLQQELTVYRGMVPGDTIRTFAEVVSVRSEPQGSRVTIACGQTDDGGAPVTELRASVLLKGHVHGAEFGASVPQAAPVRALPGADPYEFEVTPTEEFIRAYAAASGDQNPIHTDADAARQAGFPGPIAHGMSSLAVGCEIAADKFGHGDIRSVRAIGARFSLPILAGEPLTFSFRPTPDPDVLVFGCTTLRGPAIKAGWMRITAATEPGQ
ncbi:MaoC/PaaZ C-terminal domain-containing protein [Arthrobacter sp. MDT3-24]